MTALCNACMIAGVNGKTNVMKSPFRLLVSLAGVFSLFLFLCGCRKDNRQSYTYQVYSPVIVSKAEFAGSINGDPSQHVENAGRFYLAGDYIFMNEVDKGIHVIDNRMPSRPRQVAFLNIPGNQGMVVKGKTLLADMYDYLISIDISDVKNARLTSVMPNFFQGRNLAYSGDTTRIAIGYTVKDTTVYYDENTPRWYNDCANCPYTLSNSSGYQKTAPSGVAGSMAGMIVMNDYLYAISNPGTLGIVDVSKPETPVLTSLFPAGFNLETVFPLHDKLFLGGNTGMFIYSVNDPENPEKLGEFVHGFACDPVIADGNTAYVTLHTGSVCGNELNELNAVNIADLKNPMLIKSYPMTSPKGLSKDGDLLFVCDGDSGVKLFDASNPAEIVLKTTINIRDSYDVIARNGLLIVVTDDGLYQYDYSDIDHIVRLGVIAAPHKKIPVL